MILAEYTPIIELLSLDEAYLDVTENLQRIATATEIARLIRARQTVTMKVKFADFRVFRVDS